MHTQLNCRTSSTATRLPGCRTRTALQEPHCVHAPSNLASVLHPQVLALLSQELNMALPTTALFDYPTVEALGFYIAASRVCIVLTLNAIRPAPDAVR